MLGSSKILISRGIRRSFVIAGLALVAMTAGLAGCDDGVPAEISAFPAPASSAASDPIAVGTRLHTDIGCAACHSLDGSPRTAGTYLRIYGEEVELADGTTMIRDDAYLRESIVNAKTHVVKGYPPVMLSYADILTPEEVDALVALIKSLSAKEAPHG